MQTEALVFLGDLDPDAIGPNLQYATHYEPSPLGDVETLLDAVPFGPAGARFCDVGSGMGRVIFLAARRAFAQIIGIELSPALHEIARENLRTARDPQRRCRDIRLVNADAADATYPPGDLVVYLYNPFRRVVLEAVLDRLLETPRAHLAIVYHTAVERDAIEDRGVFRVVAEFPFGVVYEFDP